MRANNAWQESLEAASGVGMAVAYHAARAPDRMAVTAPAGERSFGALNARANQLARWLRRQGLGPQSGVAMICSNRPEFLEVHTACLRTGLRLTPVNWHLTAHETAYIVGNCEARVVIAEARFAEMAADALREVTAGGAPPVAALAIGGAIPGYEDYDRVLSEESSEDIEDPVLGSPMLYTSGTTGYPKGVFRWPPRPSSLIRAMLTEMIKFQPGTDTVLVTGPIYHAAPLNLNTIPPLNQGVGLVLMDKWDAEETLRLIQQHRVAFTHVVATMFHRLLRLPDEVRAKYDLSSLRAVLHGAAPCPQHVKRAMIDWLGPVVFEYYAATEGGGTLASSAEWLARPGTVGHPVAGAGVRILDDAKNDAAVGEMGTVYLQAPPEGRFLYFKEPDKTSGSYHGDFFTMGDRGYVDADGYLFLTGRDAETIISGGVNIYPQEIDAVLLRFPGVHDACAIGVPSEEWGEEVRAVVELEPSVTASERVADALIAFCREHLATFKCPRSVEFKADLPRLPSGKIQRHKVREAYWQGRDRTI